ncbi:50S ribosomal protein L21e [Candidatus Woesearchaeota archaeon]|nr:50S ribosomal protein L21e [Candidatus Woesearchaeota archaeon]
MERKGGLRRKTRSLFKKHRNEKGRMSLSRYFTTFNEGEMVRLSVESSIQKGMYHPRFYGKTGIVKNKKGRCYEVLVTDGGKRKTLIVHPIHLRKENAPASKA